MTTADLEAHRRTVATSRGPISCVDMGEGPVALFVHGLGTNALLWRRVLDSLAGQRRLIALDLPLHGRTPAAADQEFGLRALADVIEAFCTAADLSDIDLVANDTGGAVAQIFAAAHPECIRSLCLTNCETHDNVPPAAFKPTVDLAATGLLSAGAPALMADLPATRELVFGSSYQDMGNLDLAVLRSFLEPVIGTPERARQFERVILSLRAEDLLAAESDLSELRAPTLIIWGTDDIFFELSWAYWLKDLIPGAQEVIEIEGGRLFFPDERTDELVDSLREFWWGVR